MNDQPEFDFVKAFADVDLLQVAAVGRVIGRATASVYQGMLDAGLDEGTAGAIIRMALSEMFRALRP